MKLKAYNQEEIKLCYALCFSNTIALLKPHYTFVGKKKISDKSTTTILKRRERERVKQDFESLNDCPIPQFLWDKLRGCNVFLPKLQRLLKHLK